MIDAALDESLREWARWARGRHWQSQQCRSVEHKYVAPLGELYEEEAKPLPVDAREAWRIECMWRTRLPMKERMALRAHYIARPRGASAEAWLVHVRRTARALRIAAREYPTLVTCAAQMMADALRRG